MEQACDEALRTVTARSANAGPGADLATNDVLAQQILELKQRLDEITQAALSANGADGATDATSSGPGSRVSSHSASREASNPSSRRPSNAGSRDQSLRVSPVLLQGEVKQAAAAAPPASASTLGEAEESCSEEDDSSDDDNVPGRRAAAKPCAGTVGPVGLGRLEHPLHRQHSLSSLPPRAAPARRVADPPLHLFRRSERKRDTDAMSEASIEEIDEIDDIGIDEPEEIDAMFDDVRVTCV